MIKKVFKMSSASKELPKFVGEALSFEVECQCSTTKARVSKLTLPHSVVYTPVFMPVGTSATLKGVLPEQLKSLGCEIMLSNTYHLGTRPGADIVEEAGGVHSFMNWDRSVLTDSGGFQMVSLCKLSRVDEEGVTFQSPYSLNNSPPSKQDKTDPQNELLVANGDGCDVMNENTGEKEGNELLMTPEKSIEIQTKLGADIMMQLDDVVHVLTTGERVEEAMWRSIRWLDRCIEAHKNTSKQNLFAIIQGGLQPHLRKQCCSEMVQRNLPGYAIGGLSGGEEKSEFCKVVNLCTDFLPKNKPRYCMGVGYAVDLVVCSALGVDMYDCVFPTRTARFGTALVKTGCLKLTQEVYKNDFKPIEDDCNCFTCKNYTRSYLNEIVCHEPVASTLISLHNVAYQLNLMQSIRDSIRKDSFPDFVRTFMKLQFPDNNYPSWVFDALLTIGIDLSI